MPTESLAEKIKRRRAELGLTQTEFAKRLGVKLRAVQYWEAGQRTPTETVLKLLDLQRPTKGKE